MRGDAKAQALSPIPRDRAQHGAQSIMASSKSHSGVVVFERVVRQPLRWNIGRVHLDLVAVIPGNVCVDHQCLRLETLVAFRGETRCFDALAVRENGASYLDDGRRLKPGTLAVCVAWTAKEIPVARVVAWTTKV